MLYFLIGFVVGAVAALFVIKNNLRLAKKYWEKAEELEVLVAALEIRLKDILSKLKGA